uniref:HP domain-containing protein n=1 Tax=Peronospora matthiolae TaxID=2874970 RepID=A0AAV1U3Y1_9STRA
MATESGFKAAGKKAGLEVWRIEDLEPVPVPAAEQHKLYSGDSYIFLKTTAGPMWHIHFWLGKNSSTDESGVAAYKTVELDNALGGVAVQHRECQGYESPLFLSYFKTTGLQYLEGGVASGFNEVKRDEYVTRLYRIKGSRTVRVEQVPLQSSSLSVDDAYVLDAGLELFVYADREVNRLEKTKALAFVCKTREDRGGRASVVFIDEDPRNVAFWDALGGFTTVTRSRESDEHHEIAVKKSTSVLCVSGSTDDNLKVVDVTPSSGVLTKDILKTEDVFIIDVGNEMFVWVGKAASRSERKSALAVAEPYLKKVGRPLHTPITRVVEEGETPLFTALFKAWNSPKVLEFGHQPSQGVAKMQDDKPIDVKALVKAATKIEEDIGADIEGDGNHQVTVWRIEGMEKVEVPKEQYGQFYDGDSYIILDVVTPSSGKPAQVIYFWQGRSSTTDEKAGSAVLATFLDDSLGGTPVQVRVTQGKEPGHFRALFNGTMIVHAGGKSSAFTNRKDEDSYDTDGVSLYQVKGTSAKNTLAVQVEEKASSLASGDCFVLVTPTKVYEWQGAGSSGAEREIASKIASVLKKNRETAVVEEGSESDDFWQFLHGKSEYAKSKSSFEAPHEPRLFQCSNAYGYFDAREIVDFAQDDLNTDDVFILDTYTTLYVWIGAGANESERRKAMTLAENYLAVVKSDGRGEGTPIVAVHCNSEPLMFTSNFLAWDSDYFRKNEFLDPYETRLRLLKEEKAKNAPKELPGTTTTSKNVHEKEAAVPASATVASVTGPSTKSSASAATPVSPKATPVLSKTTLASPKITSPSPKVAPQSPEVTPVSPETTPSPSKATPSSSKSIPTSSSAISASSEAAPASRDANPSSVNATSTLSKTTQTSFDAIPSSFEATPMSSKAPSAPAKVNSTSSLTTAALSPVQATGRAGETFSYEQLKAGVEGIDITLKENYLTDAEFETVMEMTKDEFAELPKWKKQAKKKETGLF